MRRVSSEQNWDNDNVGRLDRASSKMLTLVSLLYNNEGKGGHSLMIDKDSVDKLLATYPARCVRRAPAGMMIA